MVIVVLKAVLLIGVIALFSIDGIKRARAHAATAQENDALKTSVHQMSEQLQK